MRFERSENPADQFAKIEGATRGSEPIGERSILVGSWRNRGPLVGGDSLIFLGPLCWMGLLKPCNPVAPILGETVVEVRDFLNAEPLASWRESHGKNSDSLRRKENLDPDLGDQRDG